MNNPFHQFMRLDPPQLVGRDFLLRQLLSGLTETPPISWQIISFRTMGSSTILQYLAHPKGALENKRLLGGVHHPFNKSGHFICLYLDCNTYSQEIDFSVWLWNKMQEDKRIVKIDGDSISALNGIKQTLVEAQKYSQRIVFLLDHLDLVLRNMDKGEATELRSLVGLAGIVTATEKPLVEIKEDVASSWFGSQLFPVNIDPLSNEDARKLVNDVLSEQTIKNHGERKEYLNLLKETGNYPYYILMGSAHWYELRRRYPNLEQNDLLEIWTNRLLTKGFYGDFYRFWTHIGKKEQDGLIDLVTSKELDRPIEGNAQIFDNLVDVGLLDWDRGHYQPFSRLWEKFIIQKAKERVVKDEVEALNGSVSDNYFTQREEALLNYLKDFPNEVCSYEDILENVWHEGDSDDNRHLLRQIISRLRQKMSEGGIEGNILNHRNKGYEYRN